MTASRGRRGRDSERARQPAPLYFPINYLPTHPNTNTPDKPSVIPILSNFCDHIRLLSDTTRPPQATHISQTCRQSVSSLTNSHVPLANPY
jgi:hypothetical protein